MVRGFRTYLAAAVAVATSAMVPVALGQPYLIVPGRSVGPIELGLRIDEAVGLLGTPLLTSDCHDYSGVGGVGCDRYYSWSTYENNGQPSPGWNGLGIGTRRGAVATIDVENPQYLTAQGIHVESTEQQVRRTLGSPAHFEDRTRINSKHPSCCYEQVLWYPGLEIRTGYAPAYCRNSNNPACWAVESITVIPIDGAPHT